MRFAAVTTAALLGTSSSCLAFVPRSACHVKFGTRLFAGDGNPPPFGPSTWGQPAASPPAAPAPANPYSDWGQPAAATTSVPAAAPASANPFADWGQPAAATAPSAPAAPATTAASAPPAPSTGVGDPISVLDASQMTSVNQIAASIPDLMIKSDLSWSGGSVSIGGLEATLDARDAPGPANVAWLANLYIPTKVSSLTIFNGPLTDVPHLLSRCCILDGSSIRFDLDFRPRAYGAYELVDDKGNYPGPETLGRKAFEYSGARNDFDTKFGKDLDFLNSVDSLFEGATPNAPSELDLLTGGPKAISVTMPLTDGNIAAVVDLRQKAASAWLTWALEEDHAHRPGAPINSQYVYDSKFRQNAYSALLPFYSEVFGPQDGAKLAAAESGPLDEAYVGGGS